MLQRAVRARHRPRRRSSGPRRARATRSVIASMPTLAGVERLVETWASLRGEDVFPGGRLSRAWNLLTRDDHLFDNEGLRALIAKGGTPKTFDELTVPLRVVACRPRHRRGGGVRRRTARARAPGEHRPPGAVPADPPRRSRPRRRRRRRHRAAVARARRSGRPGLRAQHRRRAAQPIACGRRSTSPSARSRSAASSGSSSSCAACPRASRSWCCRGRSTTARSPTSPIRSTLIDEAYRLAERSLDDAEVARSKRLTLRRPWWRRHCRLRGSRCVRTLTCHRYLRRLG